MEEVRKREERKVGKERVRLGFESTKLVPNCISNW